ncbi:MAG: 23S rRNA (uracil(1939)-C(5))-methyltransferase RlmD [Planctomycetota bacterium]|nr:23S rRNA (uracil(1939)-C(5))-methyltransferase RlmD [Planctomycetota bacterium]
MTSEIPIAVPITRKPRPGDHVDLEIEAFDGRGRGVANKDGFHYAVKRGTAGARVRALILKRRGASIEAVALETLRVSAFAATPPCAHFGSCGGCSLQDITYDAQLSGLHRLVARSMSGLSSPFTLDSVVPAPSTVRYRNKMEFTFSSRRWIAPDEPLDAPNGFALGQHAVGVHGKVVDVHACSIQADVANEILASVRALSIERALPPWDGKSHTGLMRHFVIRRAGSTGEILVNLVTSTEAPELIEPFARELVARHPAITTFVQNVNSRAADTAIGDPGRERVLHGKGVIAERVLGLEFELSAGSFFQTNSAQAERLFEIVREECALTGSEIVYDLYCGTGVIALVLASSAREVIGFELVASAVADARENARKNGVENVRFVEGDALDGLATRDLPPPDVIVVDPPRAGLHKKVLPKLAALGAKRIVYVSCHHPAAAADALVLESLGWRVARVRPIDMFPHTPHVECVLTLLPPGS